MKNLKLIFAVFIVLLTITIGYGQNQRFDKPLQGSNNIAQAVKNSLFSVPYLKVGNVTCSISEYSTSHTNSTTSGNTRFYIKGQVTVDYFDITMPDGKSLRFTQNRGRFVCNDFPPAVDGSRIPRYFTGGTYINYNAKTELGNAGDARKEFIYFTGDTFEDIFGWQEFDELSSIQSIQINCLGIDSYSLDGIKEAVNRLREDYDRLTKHWENQKSNTTINNSSSTNSTISTNQNTPASGYNSKDWEKFNQIQQSVNQWNQDWYKRIEQNEQSRLHKQKIYERAGEQIGTVIGNYINELEQKKQQEEIAKKQKAINRAVSNTFLSVKGEADYWFEFANELLNVSNKWSKNLNKTAYDEIENSLNSIKRVLDEISEEHNYLQEKLRKDWDYADNDPRRFRVSYWEDYSYKKEPYIYLSQTFTVGSRISDKTIRCNFVNDLLSLINKHAERSQSTHHITSIEQAYIASECKNYDYEKLLKSAKAIEAYEKKREEKSNKIRTLKKKIEEELVEIKVLQSTSVKVKSISNLYQIEGVDLSDLKNEYNLLIGNVGIFESELKKLNPDNLIKAYGGVNTSSNVYKPSGIYVSPGAFEITLSRELSSPLEHKVTLNALKGQKTLTIDPTSYENAFEFDARFKPYELVFANKYQKKSSFGKTRWFVPEFKFYTSGIAELNLTPISLNESYSPKGFYNGRPVFFHRLDFFAFLVGKGSFINGFITSDNSRHYQLHSDFWYFGMDILRYEPGFTMSIFKSSAELRLYGGGAISFINFRGNQKEDNAANGSSVITEEKLKSWYAKYAVYPGVKYIQRIGKKTIQLGYKYNILIGYDDFFDSGLKPKKTNLDKHLYNKYSPFEDLGKFFKHEFSVRFTF